MAEGAGGLMLHRAAPLEAMCRRLLTLADQARHGFSGGRFMQQGNWILKSFTLR